MAAANNLVRLDSTEINNSSITDTVFFTTASTNTEYVSRLYRVSDEILAASTPELLDYFLQSQFMRDMLAKEIAASSVSLLQQKNHEDYFFYHDAFNELIRRDDLTAALDMCARQITTSSIRNNDTYCFKAEFKALSEFLNHSTISSIVSKTVTTDEYSYLAHVYNNNYVKTTSFIAIDVDESMLDYYYMEADEIEQFYGAPEEMLNASTLELLDFFLHTDFMMHRLAHESASSSAAIASLNDGFFFQHEAFVELISRADLVSTIKTYATRFFPLSDDSADTSTDDFLLQKFLKFLNQSTVSELVSQTVTANTITYPCLSQMRDADVLEPRLSHRPVIQNIEGIDYYYGDTVYTVDGLPVSTIEPERNLP